MLALHVIDRLKERVAAFSGRVEGVASLVQLIQQNQLPGVTPAARVMASALQGGQPDSSAGLFRQSFDQTVTVYLVFRNVQGTGGNELDRFDDVLWAVIHALCGWAPEETVGVFRLLRGQVVNMTAGTLLYQIDFAIGDQLRIQT